MGAMIWIIDNQRGRRNLTRQQALELGFKRAELLRPKAEANLHISPGRNGNPTLDKVLPITEKVDTTQAAADYAGVSRATASKYKKVMEVAPEETKQEVLTGAKSPTAYRYGIILPIFTQIGLKQC